MNVIRFVQKLLERTRIRTRQWWILRSIDPSLGYQRNEFAIRSDGSPLDDGNAVAVGHIPFGFEVPADQAIWEACIMDTVANVATPPYRSLILDAYYRLAIDDMSGMIIHAAIAGEQATERTFARLWEARTGGKVFRRGRLMSGHDLPAHLSRDLRKFAGRSFADEAPDEFAEIERLWDARGRVAHGSDLAPPAEPAALAMIAAVERCIDWLEAL